MCAHTSAAESGGERLKGFYEGYWSSGKPPPVDDPLTLPRWKILWLLLGQGTGARLLDCGCGEGNLVAEAQARGFEAVGMEISEAAIERGLREHPDVEFVRHSVEERPWPVERESFDFAVSFEVIEHLLQPRDLVAGAYEALKPGGHLALSTPYHGPIKNLALVTLAFDSHFDVEGPHIRFFSDKALKKLLADTGFEVEKTFHLGRFRGVWANTMVWARKV